MISSLDIFLKISNRGERLAKAQGHSIQQAEMNAAKLALETCSHLFPHLNYQRRIMERSFKRQGVVTETIRDTWYKETLKKRQELGLDAPPEVKPEIKEEDVRESDNQITEVVDDNLSADNARDLSPLEVNFNPIPSVSGIKSLASNLQKENKSAGEKVVNNDEISVTKTVGETKNNQQKKENKDAVRAEIKEIEEKLKKKRQKKLAAKVGDLEDGECIDSDDEVEIEKVPAPVVDKPELIQNTASLNSTDNRHKQREDKRKRWNEGRRHNHDNYDSSRSEKYNRERSSSGHRDRRHDGYDRRDDRYRGYHDQRSYRK